MVQDGPPNQPVCLGPESLQGKPGLTDRRLVWKEAWIPGLPHAQAHTHMCVQSITISVQLCYLVCYLQRQKSEQETYFLLTQLVFDFSLRDILESITMAVLVNFIKSASYL